MAAYEVQVILYRHTAFQAIRCWGDLKSAMIGMSVSQVDSENSLDVEISAALMRQ